MPITDTEGSSPSMKTVAEDLLESTVKVNVSSLAVEAIRAKSGKFCCLFV